MKRIAVLYLGRTGAGPVYTFEMSRALSAHSSLLVILSYYIDNKEIWDKEAACNKNMRIEYIKTYKSMPGLLLSYFCIWRFAEIIRMINRFKPDMVYSSWVHYWDPLIYPFLKCGKKIKTIHDVELKKGERGLQFRLLRYFSFKYAEYYIVLSRRYVELLMNKRIPADKIIVIPLAAFSYYKTDDGPEEFVFHNKILFFGRIVDYKGLDTLLDAMKIVITAIPEIRLIIAGDGDMAKYREQLEQIKDNVEIHNYWIENTEVEKYFINTDIVAVPYTEATQSGIIALSYAFAKPAIVTNVGALAEQLHDGKTGLLVEPKNPEVLAGAIKKLMSDSDLLRVMSKNCADYYKNEMTWDSSARKILDLLKDT